MVYLSISDVIDRAWDLVKRYGLILVIVYFAIIFLQNVVGRLMAPPIDPDVLMTALQTNNIAAIESLYLSNPMGTVVELVLSAVLFLGLCNCMLQLAKGTDNEISFSHWKLDLSVYVKYVVVNFLVDIIVGLGYLCCILPGLFLQARLSFAKIHAIDCPNEGILDHIEASWEMTRGNSMTLIGLCLVQFFIIIVGLILCCIGVLPALVLVAFSDIVAYLILTRYYERKSEEAAEATVNV